MVIHYKHNHQITNGRSTSRQSCQGNIKKPTAKNDVTDAENATETVIDTLSRTTSPQLPNTEQKQNNLGN